jgi:hypothetical protein
MRRPIVAWQLSLFGDKPKPMGAWMPSLCVWSFFGVPLPPDSDEIRQFRMLYPNASQFRFSNEPTSPEPL